ncbi:rod shape-determining protein MreC [Roseivirga misakiensis]|uniref:Cell shape-determining protein MreC n=1 Tax=Roseivirga misakiensis TaxID=1563681 RepID=A0A1E5T605_9BACT|nr:rod shape-determining protein MreC [Roseivirga misakiensis]OEK06805.1 rod shape-determining protein MreC [Roseivirga misakiensis]
MGQLLAFLFKYRAFFIFLCLELLCIALIVSNNDYQRSAYINSSSNFVGGITATSDNIGDYFSLKRVNKELAEENARLREELLSTKRVTIDSLDRIIIETDSTNTYNYRLISAEIVKNYIRNTSNFFMIDKGYRDSIKPEMGVTSPYGVIGKIRSVSKNFSVGISLLNTRNSFSVKHKKSDRIGTVQWDGIDPKFAQLLYITPDVDVQQGDTIVTSGFSSIFPKDLMIGVVESSQKDANSTYLNVKVALSVDFGRLSYVQVIENIQKVEQDSLINANPEDIQ